MIRAWFARARALVFLAMGSALVAAPVPVQAKVQIDPGKVCFFHDGPRTDWRVQDEDTCIATDSADGDIVVGIRNASGKLIDKVGNGGDIVIFSPHAYAKRASAKSTYTIHRMDKASKPIKTPFTHITARIKRLTWNIWTGPGGPAIGTGGKPNQYAMEAAMIPITGVAGGISAQGEVSPLVPDARYVFEYGDYKVIAYADNVHYAIADENLRLLSPKLDNLVSFRTDFADGQLDAQTAVFAIPVTGGENGSRVLYNILPSRKGEVVPPGLVGLAPVPEDLISCGSSYDANCRQQLEGWIGIWAGESGPLVSLESAHMFQPSTERFRSVEWRGLVNSSVAVVEDLTGGFRLIVYKPFRGGDFQLFAVDGHHSDKASAMQAADDIWAEESRGIQRAYQEVLSAERSRDLAIQAAWQAEENLRAERAAAEDAENQRADALIASNDADSICAASWTMATFYARTSLADACRSLRPAPAAQSRGFWGDLAAGMAAYNQAVQSGQISVAPVSGSSGGSYSGGDNGDFNRSMQSIDNALRVISDPNWNGAAGAAQP